MGVATYIAGAVLSFAVGSVPTAYLLVKRRSGKDLRQEGSGNIGTLNAFEVTASRSVGVAVLLIDMCKGMLPLALLHTLRIDDHLLATVLMLSVVAGHNYTPWLRFHGGRGLASGAGAVLLLNPLLLGYWGLIWLAGYAKTRDVHFGNIAATVLAPFLLLVAPGLAQSTSLFTASGTEVAVAGFLLCGLIFLRHLEPLRQLIRKQRGISVHVEEEKNDQSV